MKCFNKLALLAGVFLLSLTSCSNKVRCECFETADSPDPVSGKCYQVSNRNILENIFIVNLPLNPDAPKAEHEYDFVWRDDMRVEYISLEEGLKGKRIISFLLLDPHSMRLQIDGTLDNPNATFGYVKILHLGIKPLSQRAKNANLFAYVSIGEENGLVDKPGQTQVDE